MPDVSRLSIGRKGGRVLDQEWLDAYVAGLKSFDGGMTLKTNDELLEIKRLLAGFQPDTKSVILRSDATLFEAVHELGHVKFFSQIGSDANVYKSFETAGRELEAWRHVLDYADQYPGRLSTEEMQFAREMFNEEFYRLFGAVK
ncbi:MAG: hypothetical protein JNK76_17730 [Planctomycetales bacterium]|nr:hypothetical protein [Planctomycetales bacterium]